MSIASMFDHTAQIYKFAETVTGDHRAKVSGYTAGAVEQCALSNGGFDASDRGNGTRRDGTTVVYLSAGVDVARNDVLDVTDGPNAPIKLKVLAPSRPRGHHTECMCEPFAGSLT